MKKTIINIFIILFLVSVYKDLNFGTNIQSKGYMDENQTKIVDKQPFDVIKVKVEAGETVLTIVERLNPNSNNLNVDQILADFSLLNPNIDPNKLQFNRFYFFPKYHQKKEAR